MRVYENARIPLGIHDQWLIFASEGNKLNNRARKHGGGRERTASGKLQCPRHPFVLGAKAADREELRPKKARNNSVEADGAAQGKVLHTGNHGDRPAGALPEAAELTETLKALLEVAREQTRLTDDDINELLPDGVSPDDLEALYTKLRKLGIEIVAQIEVEKAKPEEPEPEEDRRLDALDDPVRMYMNQMSRVPLLTRQQEVEGFRQIEEAELETKRLVYGLGFAAKEHCAIAEKLLAEPPKERFDRVVVDKTVATREGHLKDLRPLVEKIRALDAQAGQTIRPLAEGGVPRPSRKARARVPETRQESPGHLSEVLLQAKRCLRT